MAQITFVTKNKEEKVLEGTSGSLMKLATQNGVKGIEGECGGVCSCATCHVHVPEEHQAKTGEASEIENDLLELSDNVQDNSRLCCQLQITEDLDGLVVHVAN